MQKEIIIRKAEENNLKSLDLNIPRNKFIVVTGVSGSGKSSLIYDIIYKEAQRKYLQSFSSKARQLLGKLSRPNVEHISGLSPVISVDQYSTSSSPRSTVATMTGLYDLLRLLFARIGNVPPDLHIKPERSLFSFNHIKGACPVCKGLGVEDNISTELLIADENKTIREGALKISTPTGYIVYSQVTIDVLNRVCESEGFNVDIPWKDLSKEQKDIVLYGSDKIKIPYGKHTLESRMKWSGITAKPREEDYYKGIIPVMEVILKRDRNKNILRFVESVSCHSCKGNRLRHESLMIHFHNKNIAELTALNITELDSYFRDIIFTEKERAVGTEIQEAILKKTKLLIDLGLSYLTLNRESTTLSNGEAQRIRLANQANSNLRGIIYVLDEPSVGLHPKDNDSLIAILKKLRDNGNTVIVIEHDEKTMLAADYLIDIGPAAGKNGGELILSAKITELYNLSRKINNSKTLDYLSGKEKVLKKEYLPASSNSIFIEGARINNLKNIDIEFKLGAFNVVTGVSGAGKSSLVHQTLGNYLKNKTKNNESQINFSSISGLEKIDKLIEIDQSPIGRTPRSNPATYTKLSDHIRDLFASLPETKERIWKKGRFSFNVKGGRCEECEGAGYKQIGMHFLGNVDVLCPVCHGKRFNEETLQIKYKSKNIYDVLEMQIDEALDFFEGQGKLTRILQTMNDLGLGYLALGQSSTTLSGGEAQRIKLAGELAKISRGNTLYILDEPTTGLHSADVKILLKALNKLVEKGNTIISIEHNSEFILNADHIIDLGPGSGKTGGKLVFAGNVQDIVNCEKSFTADALREKQNFNFKQTTSREKAKSETAKTNLELPITFTSVKTNNLKNIDIEIPVNKITVVTGVSGSGKSSLAFDTIFAEGQHLFIENFSAYIRNLIGQKRKTSFESAKGLMPAIAISQKQISNNPRSTLGTLTEISDYYRLLFSRTASHPTKKINDLPVSAFSFNNEEGACEYCKGLGKITVCDPEKLVSNPEKSLINGALNGSKTGKFYGDPDGQYIAILHKVGEELNIDFSKAWNELGDNEKEIAMFGTGDKIYNIRWQYNRKGRIGEHRFSTAWQGFTGYVEEEYERKHADDRGAAMLNIMKDIECNYCSGTRYNPAILEWKYCNYNIAGLSALTVKESIVFFQEILTAKLLISNNEQEQASLLSISEPIIREIVSRLEYISNLGLSYLSIDRPTKSLSGGEAQRLRLAGMLGSGLTGIMFVLDEPTIGLHSRDTRKLIQQLQYLKEMGNTIIIVEHDEDIIRAADHIIEMGQGAGNYGGNIVASGSVENIISSHTLTGEYLSGRKQLLKLNRQIGNKSDFIKIKNAHANNLKNIDIDIPLNSLVAVTGVSGSGKTSLVFDVLYPSLKENRAINCNSISVSNNTGKVISIDNSLPGKSASSNILSYTGIYELIRNEFAKTEYAIKHKLAKRHFSFNQKAGRCEQCHGRGQIRIAMDFLQDVWIECEACKGKRFVPEVLECKYKSASIYDVLQMTIDELSDLFSNDKAIARGLNILKEAGLGYIQSGQATSNLSGGELQRLKFSKELINAVSNNMVFLLDEPSTGLHFEDINNLLKIFKRLIDEGHSIIVVEHNKGIIDSSDYIIELGPEAGEEGGEIVSSSMQASYNE